MRVMSIAGNENISFKTEVKHTCKGLKGSKEIKAFHKLRDDMRGNNSPDKVTYSIRNDEGSLSRQLTIKLEDGWIFKADPVGLNYRYIPKDFTDLYYDALLARKLNLSQESTSRVWRG